MWRGIRTPAAVRERQDYIRRKLIEEIGGFPEKTPLNAVITSTLQRDGYTVEKLIFESQPHYYVTASVFVPATGQRPFPAVLGTAGHSLDGKATELYQRAWISLAKRGFLVLAYDPPGQGERLEYLDPATGKSRLPGGGTGEHSMAAAQCLLTGTNIARWFVWDGIRAVDYLETRTDVDPKRIAVAGNSGGGTQSAYLAAFEPRLAAAAPSCYITSWEKLWDAPGPQDGEQVFASFLKDGLDFPDFLISFAPKPIHMATAIQDYFPIAGARATYAEAKRIFEILGAGDRMGYFEFDDTHGWSQPRREATYRWFAKSLQDRQEDGKELEFAVDTPKDLQASETGQVATTFRNAQTVQSINAALAGSLYARRAGADRKNIPRLVRARLGITAERATPAAEKVGVIERPGYTIEKIAMRPETGITIPALAFVPSGGPPRKPAVLYVNAAGKVRRRRGGWADREDRASRKYCARHRPARMGRRRAAGRTAKRLRQLPDRDARHPGGQIDGRDADRRCTLRVRLAGRPARCGSETNCNHRQRQRRRPGPICGGVGASHRQNCQREGSRILPGHRAGQNARRHHRHRRAGRAARLRSARCGGVAEAPAGVDRDRRSARLRIMAAAMS